VTLLACVGSYSPCSYSLERHGVKSCALYASRRLYWAAWACIKPRCGEGLEEGLLSHAGSNCSHSSRARPTFAPRTSAPSPLPVMATLDLEKISLRHVDHRNSHRRSSCIDHTCDARHDYRYLPRIICYTSVRRNTREIDARSVGVYSGAKLRGMQFYSVARVHLR